MNLPSREECEGWDPAQVALFMCQNKMPECATTVRKLRINGQRFLNLSDSDMSKFSLIHQPQLQKMVQDIRKKDDSFLSKLRRFKNKPCPKLPERDYRDDDGDFDDQLSDPDYGNDCMYEDLGDDQDASYELPPSQRVFSTTPSASFPGGNYIDSCRNRPTRPPRKPLRPGKASKQLPPEPTRTASDEEDYVSPDGSNEDDNYIEPEENKPANPIMPCRSRTGMDRPMLPTPPENQESSDFYEVPEKEETSLPQPASRLCPVSKTQSHPLPPKPSPRQKRSRSPPPVQEPTEDDEYEVCDPHNSSKDQAAEGPPPPLPKPLPKERSPKPPLKPKPALRPRQCESQTLPVMQTPDHRKPPKAGTLDLIRPKIPLPPLTPLRPPHRGTVSPDNRSKVEDKDADMCKKPWYAGACDRRTADEVLLHSNKDGAFMVRKSSGHDAQQPYTLVVFYRGRVYNIPIRFMANMQQYALGREKKGEEHFSTISHIIENHQRNPLVVIDGQNNSKDATKLCYPMKP
ncbi:B-cell linker protein isoform X1 [Platichthys flesus]|uniref:B-cell linker protein isoform X1 n=1 Tax=Platichthys flesus TaxID=8260 RepID=UPI002DBF238A|nr:B-cell linker protein isoform X1 [Platichthys flesus]